MAHLTNTSQEAIEKNETLIERCPHDRVNPYSMINRGVLQNKNLSFEERGFLAFLLSLPDKWIISRTHICKTQGLGKNKFYKLMNRLKEVGHADLQVIKDDTHKNLRRTRWFISEEAKFKKCFARPYPVGSPPRSPYIIDTRDSKEERKETRKKSCEQPVQKKEVVKENVRSSAQAPKKESRSVVKSPEKEVRSFSFTEEEKSFLLLLKKKIPKFTEKIFDRWLRKYGLIKIMKTYEIMSSQKTKIRNPEAWMENGLKENYFESEDTRRKNMELVFDIKRNHPEIDLTVGRGFCVFEELGHDYSFDMPFESFKQCITYSLDTSLNYSLKSKNENSRSTLDEFFE